jgi:hypothetical protein
MPCGRKLLVLQEELADTKEVTRIADLEEHFFSIINNEK